jgi:monoamine oxidase
MREAYDVVVIGAGAAGLAAASVLSAAPVSFVVLEARDRLGGRAHTVNAGVWPLDLGCGWLHSADVNPYSRLAPQLGFTLDKSPPPWTQQTFGVGMDADQQRAFGAALQALEERVEAANAEGGDRPVSSLLDPGCPWNPLLNAFSAYYNGDEFDRISAQDYGRFEDSEVNWRTPQGLGALVVATGADAPVVFDTEVVRLDHGGRMLSIETRRGVVRARAAVVTAPTPLIAEGRLAFSPDLPAVREAAAALPLGLADKVFLALDRADDLPADGHLFGDPHRADTGSYHLRPFGRPVIEAFFGGRHARALEAEGEGAAAAFAIEELAALLGSAFRRRLIPLAASSWGRDPFALGAYSHAEPGGVWAREALARPVDGRIAFAGEAVSPESFSTVHGAAFTGAAAARTVLSALGAAA